MEGLLAHGLRPSWGSAGRPPPTCLVIRRLGVLQQPLARTPSSTIWPFSSTSTRWQEAAGHRRGSWVMKIIPAPAASLQVGASKASTSARNSALQHAARLSSQSSTFGSAPGRGAIATPLLLAAESGAGQPVSRRIQRAQPQPASSPGGPGRGASLAAARPWINNRISPRLAHGHAGLRQAEWVPGTTIWIWRRARLSSATQGAQVLPLGSRHRTAAHRHHAGHGPAEGALATAGRPPQPRRFRPGQAAG